jgi:hypothetical protein
LDTPTALALAAAVGRELMNLTYARSEQDDRRIRHRAMEKIGSLLNGSLIHEIPLVNPLLEIDRHTSYVIDA